LAISNFGAEMVTYGALGIKHSYSAEKKEQNLKIEETLLLAQTSWSSM
jgi:hypothetical protein